jgi:IS66 C-terminal element
VSRPNPVEGFGDNGADPQAYFADVLTRLINLWPASLLDQLMPWVWAAEHSNKTRGLTRRSR